MIENQEKELELFRKKFEASPSLFTNHQALAYMKLLKEEKLVEEATTVATGLLQHAPELTLYINTYGYLLYNAYIDIDEARIREDLELFYKKVKEILAVTKPEKYSPYFATINKAIRIITGSDDIDYYLLLEMLQHLDPEDLPSQPFINDSGKEFESKKERYYRLLVRALYETKKFKECIEEATVALSIPLKWHFNAKQWVQYYLALCFIETNQFEEAKSQLITLRNRLRGVDIDSIIYDIYRSSDNIREANLYVLYDFFEKGYTINNLDIYLRLLDSSKVSANNEIITIIDQFIYMLTKEENIAYTALFSHDESIDSSTLYDKVYNTVMNNLDLYIDRFQGMVVYYNKEQEIGTIVENNTRERIFFRQSDYVYDIDVQRKDHVSYAILPTFNSKKGEESSKAILILTI